MFFEYVFEFCVFNISFVFKRIVDILFLVLIGGFVRNFWMLIRFVGVFNEFLGLFIVVLGIV